MGAKQDLFTGAEPINSKETDIMIATLEQMKAYLSKDFFKNGKYDIGNCDFFDKVTPAKNFRPFFAAKIDLIGLQVKALKSFWDFSDINKAEYERFYGLNFAEHFVLDAEKKRLTAKDSFWKLLGLDANELSGIKNSNYWNSFEICKDGGVYAAKGFYKFCESLGIDTDFVGRESEYDFSAKKQLGKFVAYCYKSVYESEETHTIFIYPPNCIDNIAIEEKQFKKIGIGIIP